MKCTKIELIVECKQKYAQKTVDNRFRMDNRKYNKWKKSITSEMFHLPRTILPYRSIIIPTLTNNSIITMT